MRTLISEKQFYHAHFWENDIPENFDIVEFYRQQDLHNRKVRIYRLHVLTHPDTWAQEILRCREDRWHWLTHWAFTEDNDKTPGTSPKKLIPNLPYLQELDMYQKEHKKLLLWKSRQLMITWLIAAWSAHDSTLFPAQRIFFQSKTEHDSYKLCLRTEYIYNNLPPFLQIPANFITEKGGKQYYANGSYVQGFPQGPDPISGETITKLYEDEARFNDMLEPCLQVADPAVGENGSIIIVTNAGLGYAYKLFTDTNDTKKDNGIDPDTLRYPMRGMRTWKNLGNKYFVVQLHLCANPFRDPHRAGRQWYDKKKGDMTVKAWRTEQNMDPTGDSGRPIYEEWNPGIHIIKPYEIDHQKGTNYFAYDHGVATPGAGLWLHVEKHPVYSEYNTVTVYRDHYYANQDSDWHADRIRESEGYLPREKHEENIPWFLLEAKKRTARIEPIYQRLIDPSTQKRSEAGKPTIFQRLNSERNEMGFKAANNNWDAGRDAVARSLKARLPDGSPVFRVFSTCTSFIGEIEDYREEKTLEEMKHDPPPGGKPMKKADHLMDTLRYLFLIPGGLQDVRGNYETEFEDFDYDDDIPEEDKPGTIAHFKKQHKEEIW